MDDMKLLLQMLKNGELGGTSSGGSADDWAELCALRFSNDMVGKVPVYDYTFYPGPSAPAVTDINWYRSNAVRFMYITHLYDSEENGFWRFSINVPTRHLNSNYIDSVTAELVFPDKSTFTVPEDVIHHEFTPCSYDIYDCSYEKVYFDMPDEVIEQDNRLAIGNIIAVNLAITNQRMM